MKVCLDQLIGAALTVQREIWVAIVKQFCDSSLTGKKSNPDKILNEPYGLDVLKYASCFSKLGINDPVFTVALLRIL